MNGKKLIAIPLRISKPRISKKLLLSIKIRVNIGSEMFASVQIYQITMVFGPTKRKLFGGLREESEWIDHILQEEYQYFRSRIIIVIKFDVTVTHKIKD